MFDNYQNCLIKMKSLEEFTHYDENMRGIKEKRTFQLRETYNADYCIYSYKTIICFVDLTKHIYCITPYQYSTTTSKQLSYIRVASATWDKYGLKRILWI